MWHGGRAILSRSAGFHAVRRMRRSVGFDFIVSITYAEQKHEAGRHSDESLCAGG